MANSCGEIRFLEGGTISESNVVSSAISNSTVTNSTISASTIENLLEVDAATAETVADAIAELSANDIKTLADALLASIEPGVSSPDSECTNGVLPGQYIGVSADVFLGAPVGWVSIGSGDCGEYMVPVFLGTSAAAN